MRWCSIHKGLIPASTVAVFIDAIEQGSGPGIGIYACKPCTARRTAAIYGTRPPTWIRRAP